MSKLSLRFTARGPHRTREDYAMIHNGLARLSFRQEDLSGTLVAHTLTGLYFKNFSLLGLDSEERALNTFCDSLPFETAFELGEVVDVRSRGLRPLRPLIPAYNLSAKVAGSNTPATDALTAYAGRIFNKR